MAHACQIYGNCGLEKVLLLLVSLEPYTLHACIALASCKLL